MFAVTLREKSYEPIGAPPSTKSRLFAMYHARVDPSDKQQILESFKAPDGACRVLFCTTAFGMGVDVSDIRHCIHYGPPKDVDDYFQESGRAGRDGQCSTAIIYTYPGCLLGHVSGDMKDYCRQEVECRRKQLLKHFPGSLDLHALDDAPHNCCDLCMQRCKCGVCPLNRLPHQPVTSTSVDDDQPIRTVSCAQREELRQQLEHFRQSKLQLVKTHLMDMTAVYVGMDILSGLPSGMVESVVNNNCEYISDICDLEEKCLIIYFQSRTGNFGHY